MKTQRGILTALNRSFLFLAGAGLLFSVAPQVVAAAPRFEVNIYLPNDTASNHVVSDYVNSLGGGFNFQSAKWYLDWSDTFSPTEADNLHAQGLIPELTWQPQINGTGITDSQVLSGQYDSYLNQTAETVKNLGYTVRINLAPEMNGDWSPWYAGANGNTAASFKSFYQYVVQKFRDNGANNVEWIWAPNTRYWGDSFSYSQLYPGDNYVTYTGLDGYNWGTTQSWSTWQSFQSVFQQSYNELVSLTGKQIILTEMASAEQGGSKAQWITDMAANLNSIFPQIKGITWFNINKETDWRIESSESSKEAFLAMVKGTATVTSSPIATSAPAQTTITKKSTAPLKATSSTATPVSTATPAPNPVTTSTPTAAPVIAVAPTILPSATPAARYSNTVIQAAVANPERAKSLATMLSSLSYDQRQQTAVALLVLLELPLASLLFIRRRRASASTSVTAPESTLVSGI